MNRYRIAVFAAVALLAVATGSAVVYYTVSYLEGNKFAEQGYEAATQGNYDTAIMRYTAALKKPISNYQRAYVWLNRGAAYNAKWRFDEALRDYTQALRLNPKLGDAYAGRGYAYLRKGENDKGIVDLTEAISLDPNSQSAYYNRGLIFLRKGELDRALGDLNEAVRCSADRAAALILRALCYVAKNDLDLALASLDGAIAIDPTNAMAYMQRSHLYGRKGERQKQEHDQQQALRLNPNADEVSRQFAERLGETQWKSWLREFADRNPGKDAHQLSQGAQAAYDLGDYDRAIQLNTDLLAMSISSAQASSTTMNRGNAYKAKGDFDHAFHDYNEAIKLNPNNAGAYVDRALIFSRDGKRRDAVNDYEAAIRLNPQQWQAYFNRAADLATDGEVMKAIADLTEVIKLNPKFVGAYVNRAGLFIRRHELDRAIDDCNTAIQLEPNLSEAYLARANAYSFKGDHNETLADLETSVRLKPRKPEGALNALAWFRATCPEAGLRDGKIAVELATRACELSQWKNAAIIDTLAAAYAEAGDFDQAVTYETRVLSIGGLSDDAHAGVQKRLELYNHREPYREKAKPPSLDSDRRH